MFLRFVGFGTEMQASREPDGAVVHHKLRQVVKNLQKKERAICLQQTD
jgi:hypothetical protein